MCADCVKFHRKQTVSKNHIIVKIDELTGNLENVMKFAEGFACSEHNGEDMKFYCRDHKLACCATCYFQSHKTCSKVIDLKEELSALLREIKPEDISAEMRKLETHLKKFMEINDSNVIDLESQVNGLTEQIRVMRKKINAVLDDLEIKAKSEGSRIYKEEAIRKQEENHQCLALVHAVRNSGFLFETVHKYGSDIQKFLMTEKIKSQLPPYYNQIRENYETIDTVTIELEFAPLVESILSLSSYDVGKILSKTVSKSLPISLRKLTKDCLVERADVIDVEVPFMISGQTYSGITVLPGEKVILADWNNKQCILLGSAYKFLAFCELTGQPVDICMVDDQEVAVTMDGDKNIQILSVRNYVISPVRLVSTFHICSGIAAAAKGEMFVTGDCGNKKHQLSLLTTGGEVKCSFQYEAPSGNWNFVALDSARTRVYITVHSTNSLICFNMDGKKQFTYSPDNLRWPLGISVDRDDSIYVLGCDSNNIHRLSPDGSWLQLITNGVPIKPRAICFKGKRDEFLVTSLYDNKFYIYQLK